MSNRISRIVISSTIALFTTLTTQAQNYQVTYLVSSGSVSAPVTDPHLINGWGMSRSSTSPWWVADQGTGLSTLYSGTGAIESLVVTVAGAQSGTNGLPTGTLYNGTSSFQLAAGSPAVFLFVSLDGTISGWSPKVNATKTVVMVSNPGAVYTGAAIAEIGGVPYLYVANFASGQIEVYDGTFKPVTLSRTAFQIAPTAAELERTNFDTPLAQATSVYQFVFGPLGSTFKPFNIQNIGGTLYATYAQVNPANLQNADGAGLGYVLAFEANGTFVRPLAYGSWFNAPWGVAAAPSDFGPFSHCLLVGNFGDGHISAFNAATGAYLGQLADQNGVTIAVHGLWAISFGNGGNAGPLNSLYFAAGPANQTQGSFGNIAPLAAGQVLGNGQ